jgi:pyruvate/2-oxoglutarate dehydrogenase complex dihydrolipoamide acyltransferase (E2) component
VGDVAGLAAKETGHYANGVVRKMMNLSSSFDHRIVDGWDAASLIQEIKGFLEQPAVLFVGEPRWSPWRRRM